MSLKMILGFRSHDADSWMADVVKTQASEGKGIDDVGAMVQNHRTWLETTGTLEKKRRARLERRIREIIEDQLHSEFWDTQRSRELHEKLDLLLQRQTNPYDVAAGLLEHFRTTGARS